jgi:hypothetical protein
MQSSLRRKSILISEARRFMPWFVIHSVQWTIFYQRVRNESFDKITGIIWKIATYVNFHMPVVQAFNIQHMLIYIHSSGLIYWKISYIFSIINQFNIVATRKKTWGNDKSHYNQCVQLTMISVYSINLFSETSLFRFASFKRSRRKFYRRVRMTSVLSVLTSYHLKELFTFNSSASM